MAFIDSLQDKLSSLFKKKESYLTSVGIDIGATSIKVVQLSLKNNKIILDTYGAIATGPYADMPVGSSATPTPEKIGEAIKELIKECKIDINNIAMSLPTSACLLKDITVPASITDSEMKTVVSTEARRVVPVPINDVDIDWLPLPAEILPPNAIDASKKNLLLVAVSHETQKRTASYAALADIVPRTYEIEIFSSMRSVYTHERAPIVLIDLGGSHIKVSIIHEGSMRRAISLDRGFNEIETALVSQGMDFITARKIKHGATLGGVTENENIINNTYKSILSDIQNVVSEYEKYSHASPVRAVLLGGGAEMNGIVEFTQNILGFSVEKSHPFERTVVPDLVKDIIPSIEPEFTIATGLAMRLLA